MMQTFTNELRNFFIALLTPEQKAKETVKSAPKPKKEVIYKADVKACEEYLLRRQVDKGMHNLTTKFHKKC